MLIQGKNRTSSGFEVLLMVPMNITVMPYRQVAGCAPTAPIVLHGVTSWRAAVCVCVYVTWIQRQIWFSLLNCNKWSYTLLCVLVSLAYQLQNIPVVIYLPSLLNMGIYNDVFFQWNGHNELSSSSSSSSNNNKNKVTSLIYSHYIIPVGRKLQNTS